MKHIQAVIFDMDGVLIDSEPLWRIAMIQGFGDIGIDFTDEDCRKTTGMRFKEVFLKCAVSLNILPANCLVIEDSINGVLAGKAAGMTVIAIPDIEHKDDPRFEAADHRLNNLPDVIKLF